MLQLQQRHQKTTWLEKVGAKTLRGPNIDRVVDARFLSSYSLLEALYNLIYSHGSIYWDSRSECYNVGKYTRVKVMVGKKKVEDKMQQAGQYTT